MRSFARHFGTFALNLLVATLAFQTTSIVAEPVKSQTEIRESKDVFKKWLSWQYVFDTTEFPTSVFRLQQDDLLLLSNRLPTAIQMQLGFLNLPFDEKSQTAFKPEQWKIANNNVKSFYEKLSKNIPALVGELKTNGFSTEKVNEIEEDKESPDVTNKYRDFTEALFQDYAGTEQEKILFTLSNRMFEYCFSAKYGKDCAALMKNPETYPIVRFFYANIWYHLSGNGWRVWHAETLRQLRDRYLKGHEVVYIAGGSDIYQLIQAGVYNIRVIDPMLPSQTKYYSEGWDFLISSNKKAPSSKDASKGIGDEIVFSPDLKMVRTDFKETGKFKTGMLSNSTTQEIVQSVTTWKIIKSAKEVGHFVLERRFSKQADFATIPKKTLLISFNELYYITCSGSECWGIDPNAFDSNFEIFVKQLAVPVNRPMALNLFTASLSDFSYIKLGTSVN